MPTLAVNSRLPEPAEWDDWDEGLRFASDYVGARGWTRDEGGDTHRAEQFLTDMEASLREDQENVPESYSASEQPRRARAMKRQKGSGQEGGARPRARRAVDDMRADGALLRRGARRIQKQDRHPSGRTLSKRAKESVAAEVKSDYDQTHARARAARAVAEPEPEPEPEPGPAEEAEEAEDYSVRDYVNALPDTVPGIQGSLRRKRQAFGDQGRTPPGTVFQFNPSYLGPA